MRKQFVKPVQDIMDKAEKENKKLNQERQEKKDKIKRHWQVVDNDMPKQFFEWMGDCPVSWGITKQDHDSIEYIFIVPTSAHYDEENE
tara:strand:- start:324 stop:587 length:264 start_codon:yes stop_codon:yes gene_type:complete